MRPISWVGILSVVLGIVILAYQGIDYTRQKRVVDVGSLHVTKETHEQIPVSPVIGGLVLVLLIRGAGKKS
jgi:hypothetical protein